MSYSQIFRRINRLIKSNVKDVLELLTKDERELFEFDQELKKTNAGKSSSQQGQDSHKQSSSSQQGEGRSQQSGQDSKQQANPRSRRKPGEKDDSYYFSVLGIPQTSSQDEIKRAYKKLMSKYHPDRVATLSEDLQKQASEKAQTINEAYQIISRRRGFR